MTPPAVGSEDVAEVVFEFDDLPAQEGRTFLGPWFVVDSEHGELFKQASYIPRNPYRFEQSTYPDDLLEGFHLLALLDHLSNPLVRLTDGRLAGWNYGLDRVRFVSPAAAGDRVRLRGSIAEVRPHRDGFLVRLDCTLEGADPGKPIMVAEWWVLFLRESRNQQGGVR